MKYGVLVYKDTTNVGDDIQSYAASQFLPKIDVIVDREELDISPIKGSNEPVALIMAAWFLHKRFNWPPSRQFFPLLISYHHYERSRNPFNHVYSIPVFREHYDGIGGEWFKNYGPVGCRDLYTCEVFSEKNIPSYFSGCITLTLPKQNKTPNNGKYICFVDLDKEAGEKIQKLNGGTCKIIHETHFTDSIRGSSWEERVRRVERYLTLYQNAKYVATGRLHVALPCLAMGVPVMCILPKSQEENRYNPYSKWLHFCNKKDFLEQGYAEFDFVTGTPNKNDYLPTRNELIARIHKFIEYCELNKDKDMNFFSQKTYTEDEENMWKIQFLRKILNRTHNEAKYMQEQFYRTNSELIRLQHLLHIHSPDKKICPDVQSGIQ